MTLQIQGRSMNMTVQYEPRSESNMNVAEIIREAESFKYMDSAEKMRVETRNELEMAIECSQYQV